MKLKKGESPESFREKAKAARMGLRSARALTIGAFALGVLVGGTVAIGLLVSGRVAIDGLNIGKPRPRRLLIGNLEIEERGDDTRFRVE